VAAAAPGRAPIELEAPIELQPATEVEAPIELEAPAEAGGSPLRPQVDPEQLWPLELRLGGRVLDGGLLAVDHDGELLLPLAGLAAAFELAVHVDPARARAQGWLIHPHRLFELDLGERTLHIEAAARDLGSARIIVWSGDIYVDARSLSAWWPVDLSIDRRRLRLEAVSRETLPIESRLAREKLHERLGLRGADPGGPAAESPYRWWSVPAVDLKLYSRSLRAQGGGRDWQSGYDLAAAGDLLQLRSELLWTGIAGEYSRLRMRAGRRDLDGEMAGPLHLREFTLGDVSTPSLPFVSQMRGGRGIQLSSFPLNYFTELGQLTLDGDLRLGWDVELYQNEVLIDFQGSSDDLRYAFEDVPTVPGLNVFRLVFHGPLGETREEERRVWMDGGLAPAGETRSRVTFNQHDSDLLAFGDLGGDEQLRGEPRAIGEVEHGFGETFTLALGAATLPLLEGRHHYATLAARTELDGSFLRADLLGVSGGGWGVGAGWQTRLGRTSLALSHHEFRDFLSERTRSWGGGRLLGRSEANVDGSVPLRRLPLYYRVGFGHSRLREARLQTDADLRLSTWLRPVWLTHTLRGRVDRGDGIASEYLEGELLASHRRGPLGLRGRLAYGAAPAGLRSIGAVGDWTPDHLNSVRLGVTHAFGSRTSGLAALSRRVSVFVMSSYVEVDDRGIAQAGLGMSFGITPDPHTGRARWQDPTATRTGVVDARVFLDQNANGRYDAGDEPLPGVGFLTPGRGGTARSDAWGRAFLVELPIDGRIDVGIDAGTIEDPHWRAPRESERIVLRPGAPLRLDFPVVPVGEIDGWVRVARGGGPRPMPGISVQLVDASGEVLQSTRSQIDGFYVFQEIVPGRYRLRVDPDQVRRLGLVAPAEREVVLSAAGAILSDEDLELRAP
jgi:hypothetical protein